MAIAVVMDFNGATLEQYDQVIEKMHFSPAWIRVTDVWNSREQFDAFAQEQIGPITAEVGITGPPEFTFFEVHSYLTAGDA